MKKQSLLLGLLVGGLFAMTSCSDKTSTVAYEQQTEAEAASNVTDNTAPIQIDNQTEAQEQEADVISEEAAAQIVNDIVEENAAKGTDEQKARTFIMMVPGKGTSCTSRPVITICPQATKRPVTTNVPEVTKAPAPTMTPQATKTPTPTKAPVATKTPTATKIPQATKTPTPTKVPATSAPESGNSNSSYSASVLKLVNEQRKANGLSALTTTTALQNAATKRAKEIVTSFSHTRPDGTSGVTVLKEYGISYMAWGENIAYGQKTPAAVMDAWMNSSGHRANILSTKFGKVGIGCYQHNGVLYWTQVFTN